MRGNAWGHRLDRWLGIPLIFLIGVWARLWRRRPAQPRRILWTKLAAMGDTVLLVPALRAVRQAYPNATIAFLATRINGEVLRACPYIDELIVFDVQAAFARPWKLWPLLRRLRAFAPDLALDGEQWTRLTPLLGYLAGAARRVGFRTPEQSRHHLFTDVVDHLRGRHEVECFLDLVRALGIEPADTRLELFLDEAARQSVELWLHRHEIAPQEPLVVFHPGCGQHGGRREWAPERYAALGDLLAEHYGARVVITGDPSERVLAETVAAGMKHPALVAAGETSMLGLAALIARAGLVVCGNTGAMHLAAAAGVPTVALHGPTDPAKWGPWGNRAEVVRLGLSCSPCLYLGHEYGCVPAPCMGDMSVGRVWEATRLVLGESKTGTRLSV